VVLTFTDVSRFKLATESAEIARSQLAETRLVATQIAREFAEAIVDTVVEPLVVLDSELQVVSASHSFYKYFNVSMNETVGHKIYDLGNGQWNIVALRDVLDHILQKKGKLDGFVVEHVFPGIGWCRMVLNARRIATSFGVPELILLAMTLSETPKTR
jgi:two-component system CheB/CheR fusion protein